MFVSENQFLVLDRHRKNSNPQIVLASASPRRRDLLKPFFRLKIAPADCDERMEKGESARSYVKRISSEKWRIVARKQRKSEVVVAADTIVVLKGRVLGKPKNENAAKQMINKLSGKTHQVISAIVVGWSNSRNPEHLFVSNTRVSFREILEGELKTYLRSGDWKGKAGAYAIQGSALSFCSEVHGSLTGVVGLPLKETLNLIEKSLSRSGCLASGEPPFTNGTAARL